MDLTCRELVKCLHSYITLVLTPARDGYRSFHRAVLVVGTSHGSFKHGSPDSNSREQGRIQGVSTVRSGARSVAIERRSRESSLKPLGFQGTGKH